MGWGGVGVGVGVGCDLLCLKNKGYDSCNDGSSCTCPGVVTCALAMDICSGLYVEDNDNCNVLKHLLICNKFSETWELTNGELIKLNVYY